MCGIIGTPGVICQVKSMIYGPHTGVGGQACIPFCLLLSEPCERSISSGQPCPEQLLPFTSEPRERSEHRGQRESERVLPFT